MTCRLSSLDWLDVLYTSVRNTRGGVADAARFLAERRGKKIHAESLRAKLSGAEGESLSVEFAELLTEWMQEKARPDALDWLHAMNARFGLVSAPVAAHDDENANAIASMLDSHLALTINSGALCQEIRSAMQDGKITKTEAEAIASSAQKSQRKLAKLARDAMRAAGGE